MIKRKQSWVGWVLILLVVLLAACAQAAPAATTPAAVSPPVVDLTVTETAAATRTADPSGLRLLEFYSPM